MGTDTVAAAARRQPVANRPLLMSADLVPTPLVEAGAKPTIGTSRTAKRFRFRLLYVYGHLLALLSRMVWLKLRRRLSTKQLGIMLAQFCLRMGVLWIKVGQILSMRADLLPLEVCDELARLQDFNEGFGFEQIKAVLEDELGRPLSHFFSDFEELPFAAASTAQVHRAQLKEEGVWTAVKVQLPDAEANFKSDMLLGRGMVWLLTRLSIAPHVRWNEMLWEIDRVIREELDYRYEATSMRRMRKRLRKHPIYVPKVFRRYTTKRVLVMEYISGVLMSDYIKTSRSDPAKVAAWRQTNNVSPRRVLRRLMFSFMRQVLEENLFHGDLHPGNVVLLRDNHIALLDFGGVGFTERELLRKYDLYMQALARGQYVRMADIYLLCADRLPPHNLSDAKELFSRTMQVLARSSSVKDLPHREKSVSAANDALIRLMGRHGISPVWGFLRQTRAFYALDSCARELWPESNVFQMVRQYYRRKDQRERKRLGGRLRLGAAGLRFLIDAPVIASEYMMFRGSIVRRSARVFEGASNRVTVFLASVFGFARLAVLSLGAWLLTVWSYQHAGFPSARAGTAWLFNMVPRLDEQVWFAVAIVVFFLYKTLANLRREFARKSIWEASSL